MNNETKLLIKQQSILEAARMLGIRVRGKMALCYSGHDKNPSLSFNDKIGLFKCFGCGASGDIIKLVQEVKGTTFSESCNWLMAAFNIFEDGRKLALKVATKTSEIAVKPLLKAYNGQDVEVYNWIFSNLELSSLALDYLVIQRGFSQELVKKLTIKDILNPTTFFQSLKTRFGQQRLLDCGLLKSDSGEIKNVWWDHVIIFPFFDMEGNINYIQGRRVNPGNIKYVNLSNVKPGVYNLGVIKGMSSNERLFICEGVPDTVSALQMGWKAIGILGAANFDPSLVPEIEDFSITVVPDVDQGGSIFFKSIKKSFLGRGRSIYKMDLKHYNDLNEYYLKENSKL